MVDPTIVSVQALDYASHACVLYQRISVMASDLTLLYALLQLVLFLLSTILHSVLTQYLPLLFIRSFNLILQIS